jgi:hypothetical protein
VQEQASSSRPCRERFNEAKEQDSSIFFLDDGIGIDETMDPAQNGRNRPRWSESPGIMTGMGCSFFCTGLRGGMRHTGRSGQYRNGIDNYDGQPKPAWLVFLSPHPTIDGDRVPDLPSGGDNY